MGLYGPGVDVSDNVAAQLALTLSQLIDNLLTNGAAVADGAVTDAKVAASAAIAQSKIAGLVADLAAKQAGFVPTAVKTANYAAAVQDYVLVDATAASRTVTLPTAPADKSRVGVKMVAVAGSFTTAVACGGSDKINLPTGSASATLTVLNQSAIFQYVAATATWTVQSGDLPLSSIDARFVGRTTTETITGAKTFDVATAAAPVKITGPNPQTAADLLQIIGPDRVLGNPASGKYRVIVDTNLSLQTNAAIIISTGQWTGSDQSVPPVVAQGRPVCLGITNDIVGPMIFAQNNSGGSFLELQDYQDHKVVNAILPSGAGGLGAWLGVGDVPIGTLTLSDKYDGPASGGANVTSLIMRHGITGSLSSARLSQPSTGDLDISSNFLVGENAIGEWAIRFSGPTGITFFSAPSPGGTRTEQFRITTSGPEVRNVATAGAPNANSPHYNWHSAYWNGSASVQQGFRVRDVQYGGGGGHVLNWIVDESNLIMLSMGSGGQVAIGSDTFASNPGGTGQLHVAAIATGSPAIVADTAASSTADIQKWRVNTTEVFAVDVAGLPKWSAAGNQQTTVGAAGGASALPATPTKYLKIKDSAGTTLVIPAYAAA